MIKRCQKFHFRIFRHVFLISKHVRPVQAPGCKNGPAPFPGRMSYKATKPGLAPSVVYLSMFYVLLIIRALFCIVFFLRCYVFCLLVVLVELSVLAKWLANIPISAIWFVGELVCRRFRCRRVDLSASWTVGKLVCRRLGLSATCPVTL